MKNKNSHPTMKLFVQKGGCFALADKEAMPQYLIFSSSELQRTWRIRLRDDTQQGCLKLNGEETFRYKFDGFNCTVQHIENGNLLKELNIEEITMVFKD